MELQNWNCNFYISIFDEAHATVHPQISSFDFLFQNASYALLKTNI